MLPIFKLFLIFYMLNDLNLDPHPAMPNADANLLNESTLSFNCSLLKIYRPIDL